MISHFVETLLDPSHEMSTFSYRMVNRELTVTDVALTPLAEQASRVISSLDSLSRPFSSLWLMTHYLSIHNNANEWYDLAKTILDAVVKSDGDVDVAYQMLGHLDGELRVTIFEAARRSILEYLNPRSKLPEASQTMLMKYIDIVKHTVQDISEQSIDEAMVQIVAGLKFAAQRLAEEFMSRGDGSAISDL